MALIKLHNNRQGVGSTPVAAEIIVDLDEPNVVAHGGGWTLPDFTMLVTNAAGTSGQTLGAAVDITTAPGGITDADIYASLNAVVEAALADPYHIPVLRGIVQQSTGVEFPIVLFDTAP